MGHNYIGHNYMGNTHIGHSSSFPGLHTEPWHFSYPHRRLEAGQSNDCGFRTQHRRGSRRDVPARLCIRESVQAVGGLRVGHGSETIGRRRRLLWERTEDPRSGHNYFGHKYMGCGRKQKIRARAITISATTTSAVGENRRSALGP